MTVFVLYLASASLYRFPPAIARGGRLLRRPPARDRGLPGLEAAAPAAARGRAGRRQDGAGEGARAGAAARAAAAAVLRRPRAARGALRMELCGAAVAHARGR